MLTSSGSVTGGVLTAGTWSVQTPATFTITPSGSGFTLTTSKGPCSVVSGQFKCGSGITAAIFGSVGSPYYYVCNSQTDRNKKQTTSGSHLLVTFSGSSVFSAASVPSGSTQVSIFTGSGNSQVISLVFNSA